MKTINRSPISDEATSLRVQLPTGSGNRYSSNLHRQWSVFPALLLALLLSTTTLLSCTDSTSERVQIDNTKALHQARVEEGLAAYQQSKYTQTYKLLQPLAQEGDIRSQALLGEMYSKGNGVSRSPEESFKWYSRAAQQGHAEAQYQLASMYAHGMGVAQDLAQASIWSLRAEASGFGQTAAAEEGTDKPAKENL
ncbi:MAG: tetratricopeptide repeat protein [Sedimenticola sp.]